MKSLELFERSKKLIPGGVNSPVRAFGSVGMTPPFIKKAKGSKIIDVEGKEYIDYVCSWGPLIHGHAHEEILNEIMKTAQDGTSFGAPTEKELILAEMICDAVPSIDMVRMVNSGTEAVMSAIRLARGYTGRDKILKFEGCYHGHSDGLLVKAGSGALTLGEPNSKGVPADYAKNTLTSSYNNVEELKDIFKKYGNEIATVIIEPIAGNMGVIPPSMEFLKELRSITNEYGALLIFDEVITGFRIGYSGAQSYLGITADIIVFGKIIGGGMPVGAYGGRKEIMDMISPTGGVYQAGTLSGNPVAMAAGIKTLELLKADPNIYERLEEMATQLESAYIESSKKYNVPLTVNRIGSMLSVFFTQEKVTDFEKATTTNTDHFIKYFAHMLENNIYLAPSPYEAIFLSNAHTQQDIQQTIKCIDRSIESLKEY